MDLQLPEGQDGGPMYPNTLRHSWRGAQVQSYTRPSQRHLAGLSAEYPNRMSTSDETVAWSVMTQSRRQNGTCDINGTLSTQDNFQTLPMEAARFTSNDPPGSLLGVIRDPLTDPPPQRQWKNGYPF